MRTITINVSEPVYEDFRRAARRLGRPTSELIRDAMELYRSERLHPTGDLSAFRPRSAGKVLRPLTRQDDLLAELVEREQ